MMKKSFSKFELAQGEIQTIVSKVDDSISTWKKSHKNFKREKPVIISLDKKPFDTANSIFVFSGSGRFGKQQDLWLSDKGEFYFKVDNGKVQQFWNAYHITDKKFSTKAFVWGLLDYYEGGNLCLNGEEEGSEQTKDEYMGCYQFLLKRIEIVHKKSFDIPFYTLTDLYGKNEIMVGGCRIPEDDDMGIRKERVLISSIALHFLDRSCSEELERLRDFYDVDTIDCTDIYVGVDEWMTEEGRKWCISGSNFFVGEDEDSHQFIIKGDSYMLENEKYSLFKM